jgi:hypothetical protein
MVRAKQGGRSYPGGADNVDDLNQDEIGQAQHATKTSTVSLDIADAFS